MARAAGAEDGVDHIIRRAFFPRKAIGTLVEVGAARPDLLSIGQSFRARGWKVISIEPIPEFCAAHRAAGHDVLEYAVSDTESDDAEFTVVDSMGADYNGNRLSFESFSSLGIRGDYANLYAQNTGRREQTIKVKVRRLDTVLATHEPHLKDIDILAVDVEGWELNVMRGLTRFQPKTIILENLFLSNDYVEFMRERGYALWRRYPPNDIYVPEGGRPSPSFIAADGTQRLFRLATRLFKRLAQAVPL